MSKHNRIERLSFTNFRGATKPVELPFDPKEPVVLIFGENGTGKSTIADAIDFVCNQSLGSVALRSGTKAGHIVAVEANGSDLAVELHFAGQSWQASLASNKAFVRPPQPPKAFVLRRADITRIMEATDSKRYEALQAFITVPAIEKAERTLNSLCRQVKKELDNLIQQKVTAEGVLEKFWEAEGKPSENHLAWARTAIQRSITDLEAERSNDKSLLNHLDQALKAAETVDEVQVRLERAQATITTQQQQMAQLREQQSNADLVATLDAVQAYLQNHPELDHCPVCTKPETHDTLAKLVSGQLSQLQQVQQQRKQLEQAQRTLEQANGAVDAAQQRFRETYRTFRTLLQSTNYVATLGFMVAAAEDGDSAIRSSLRQLSDLYTQLEMRIHDAQKSIDQYNALSSNLSTIDELTTNTQETNALHQRLQAMLKIVEEERKHYVQQTVNRISAAVSSLYSRIHPDEPLGDLSFNIKANTRGSLELTSKFGNADDIPPAAYYSEAHLDTLGLCVYLALAKQSGNAIVVLDDILMSVDDPHLDRIIDLINEEATNFGHVVITTHSRAWFDRMRQGNGMRAQPLELYGWSMDNGINHSRALPAVEELREAVNALRLDRQSVASRSGILLEQLLDALTLRYGCRLQRKPIPDYTLGELADGFDKNLRKLLRSEHVDDKGTVIAGHDLAALIIQCTQDTWIRNQVGAHFNPKAAGISDSMVKQFGERVLALADVLLCSECHQLPKQNKSGSYLQCGGGCGRTRLYPLQAPQ